MGHARIIRILLEHGPDVAVRSQEYGTAMEAASKEGRKDIVQILQADGASLDTDGEGSGSARDCDSEVNSSCENPDNEGCKRFCGFDAEEPEPSSNGKKRKRLN